jgi:cytochrome c2
MGWPAYASTIRSHQWKKGFMPANKMTYEGMKDEADRRDLIAYLKQQARQ